MTKYDCKIIYSANFKKILDFYLFDCLVPEVSKRGYSLEKYNWTNTAKLEREMKKLSHISENNWKLVKNSDDFANYTNLLTSETKCCLFTNNKGRNVLSILYGIRNSFAHGSFDIKTINRRKIYFLDAYKESKTGINRKARIVLYQKTLLDWIKLIKDGDNDK